MTPFHKACEAADVATVRRLLRSQRLDVDALNKDDERPIHLAIQADHARDTPRVLRLLIDAGADVNAHGFAGHTPLHCAAVARSLGRDVVDMLVNAGADPNALADPNDPDSERPLHAFMLHGGRKVDLLKALIERGADVHVLHERGTNLLGLADSMRKGSAVRQVLIDAGLSDWRTPLDNAVRAGDLARVRALIAADPSCVNPPNRTISRAEYEAAAEPWNLPEKNPSPLFTAVELGLTDIALELIKAGADLLSVGPGGETIASLAVREARAEELRACLATGQVDPNDIVLRDRDDDDDDYHAPSALPPLYDVQLRLGGETLFHRACDMDLDGVQMNEDDEDDAEEEVEPDDGNWEDEEDDNNDDEEPDRAATTPAGVRGTIQALVDAGANVNARTRFGCSPIHFAVNRLNGWAVEMLLLTIADVRALTDAGDSIFSLHYKMTPGALDQALARLDGVPQDQHWLDIFDSLSTVFSQPRDPFARVAIALERLRPSAARRVYGSKDEDDEDDKGTTDDDDDDDEEDEASVEPYPVPSPPSAVVDILADLHLDALDVSESARRTLLLGMDRAAHLLVSSAKPRLAYQPNQDSHEASLGVSVKSMESMHPAARLLADLLAKTLRERNITWPLHEAAARGDATTVRRLLAEKAAHPLEYDQYSRRAIFYAVVANSIPTIEALLEPDTALFQLKTNTLGVKGTRAHHVAAAAGHAALIPFLRDRGADLFHEEINNPFGSLIHCAIISGSAEAVKMVLQLQPTTQPSSAPEADENERINPFSPVPPIQLAAQLGHDHLVDLLVTTEPGKTLPADTPSLLHWASGKAIRALLRHLENPAEAVDAKDPTGATPLMYAACRGDVEGVRALIEAGARVLEQDAKGWSALHYAAFIPKTVHRDVLDVLRSAGGDLTQRDRRGVSPADVLRARSDAQAWRSANLRAQDVLDRL